MKTLNDFINEIDNENVIKALIQTEQNEIKSQELGMLIEKIGKHYLENELFLKTYTDDIIRQWSHNLDIPLVCFRNLVNQIAPINKWK